MIPEMKPSAAERASQQINSVVGVVVSTPAARLMIENTTKTAYSDGFLAAVALLQKPSEKVLLEVGLAIHQVEDFPAKTYLKRTGAAALRALSEKLAEP